MAATFAAIGDNVDTIVTPKVPGAALDCIIELTGDASYPTGGYVFGNTQLQTLFGGAYSSIWFVDVANPAALIGQPATTAYLASYDRVSQKVQLFTSNGAAPAAFAELPNATSVTTVKVRLRVRFY